MALLNETERNVSPNILEIRALSKKYGSKLVLEDVDFEVMRGEFLSLLGPSGCGKSTLLRLLIGIEASTTGRVFKDGEDVSGKTPFQRKIGIVFQNYALFPNMTVYENVAYALRARKLAREEIDARVREMIETVGLSEHIEKKPRQLSGGQQQRVAMARTLVLKPDIILFDEPMSALDAEIKLVLRRLLKELQQRLGITMIYVTHDQEEAFALSDRVMLMNEGRIVQLAPPAELYHQPKNDFVRRFIGDHLDQKLRSIRESIGP